MSSIQILWMRMQKFKYSHGMLFLLIFELYGLFFGSIINVLKTAIACVCVFVSEIPTTNAIWYTSDTVFTPEHSFAHCECESNVSHTAVYHISTQFIESIAFGDDMGKNKVTKTQRQYKKLFYYTSHALVKWLETANSRRLSQRYDHTTMDLFYIYHGLLF